MVDTQAPYAATQDAIAAAQAREAAGAAQAAAINAAYMANQLPVLPKMGTPSGGSDDLTRIYQNGVARDVTPSEYMQIYGRTPEQSEAAKYASFNAPIDYAKYANVPLSQMPANVASRVQDYYAAHPTEKAQAITAQYEAQRNRVVSVGAGGEASVYQAGIGFVSIPTDRGTGAADIAREIGKTGAVDIRLGLKAAAEGVNPTDILVGTGTYLERPSFKQEVLTTKEGQRFVNKAWEGTPIRQNVALADVMGGTYQGPLETGIHVAPGDWGGLYTPDSAKAGVSSEAPGRLRGSNIVAGLADTNYEVVSDKQQVKDTVKTYVPFGSYTQTELENTKLAIDKKTGEVAIYQYNKGTDTWSLIGGGGRNALQSGMFSVGKAMTPFVTTQEGVGTYKRPSGEGLSRLGAESTAGVVRPLSEMTLLAPNEAISRYFGSEGKFNLANLVQPVAAGKAEEPGAHIHWTLPGESPAIQYMDKGGIVPGSAITVPSGGRLVGGKTVAGVPTVTETGEALPAPFVSALPTTTVEKPTGEIFGANIPVASQILAFFQPGKEVTKTEATRTIPEVTTLEKRAATPIEGGVLYTDYYKTTGGKVTTETTTEKATPSGFDVWLAGAEKTTADITGISRLRVPSTEEIKSYAPLYGGFLPPAAAALSLPQTKEYAASFIRGEATQVKERPLESAISYGIGYTMGAGWKGLEAIVGAGRAGASEQIISKGGAWRAADIFAGGVMKYAPVAMGATYAADVTARVTKGGTDISPAAAERAGAIAIGEAIPMGMGFGRGYEAPTKAYTAARESQIGYRQAQVEIAGERTTLLQKPTAPGEVSFKDVATYVYGPKVSAAKLQAADILSGRIEGVTVGRAVEFGVKPTERLTAAKQAALEAVVTAKVLAKPTIEASLGRASIEVARYRYAENQPIAEAVYGKYFEAKTKLPVKAEQALISAETGLWTFAQKAKTPSITIKSAIQERGGLGIDTTMIKRPAEEITRLNVLYEAGKKFGSAESAAVSTTAVLPTTGKFRKTAYGTGLAKEPSLKSMGVSEKAAKTGTRAEYRGKPASEKMKPMGERAKGTKQAATAMQIMSEKLAVPEGMTRGKVTPMPQRTGLVGFPQVQMGVLRTGVVQVIEPTTELTQKQRTVMAQQQEVVPALMGAAVTAQRTAQEVTQKQRQALAVTQMSDIATGIKQTERTKQAQTEYSRQVEGMLQVPATKIGTREESASRQEQRITIGTTTAQRQEQKIIETGGGRYVRGWEEGGRIALPGWTPSGGGAGGGARKGSRAYVEVLGFETSRGRKGAWTFGKRKVKK